MQLAQGKLDVVGIQQAHPADFVFRRKHLRLELDAIFVDQLWPHVQVSGFLHVWVAKLENNLRVACEKSVLVRCGSAQDERVVVEFVILGIQEEHFSGLRLQIPEALRGKTDVGVLRGALYDLCEVIKTLD